MRRLAILLTCLTAAAAVADDTLPMGANPDVAIGPRLVNRTRPRTVQLLGEAIAVEPNAARRCRLAADLGATRLSGAVEHLRTAMRDADPLVRASAARACIEIDSAPARLSAELALLLRDPAAAVRREAVLAGARADPQFVRDGLDDADGMVRRAALASAATVAHADAIAARLRGMDEPTVVCALRTLGRIGTSAHADAVAAMLGGSTPVKSAAASALGRLGGAGHAGRLESVLEDAHPSVRAAAARSLANPALLPPARRLELGIRLAGDSDATVRMAAARLMGSAPDAKAAATLRRLLDDVSDSVRWAAVDGLVALGELATPTAVDLLGHANPRRREDGSVVLGRLRSKAALASHAEMLEREAAAQNADLGLLGSAAAALGEIGDPSAGPALRKAAATARRHASQQAGIDAFVAAVVACAKVGERGIIEDAAGLIGNMNANPRMRIAAVWATGLLADDAQKESLAGRLMGRYRAELEDSDVKYESLKAIGHMGYEPMRATLRDIAEGRPVAAGQAEPDPMLRWIAHWAADRIEGRKTPYTPPERDWVADTVIRDLGD